ncbi:bifunctional 23S rRNA (guanine(2069)-N(7))-methyltransferase RlmK/23S rRNA (guanine(2445)-N(2))-methyltransferase RlmL [Guyparkeria hydrothermalis]|uniref:bifunctional 23S rRNA (guanine(2069)-N(7))-methyltransferase RlmK/23S rRNA (guanine(2445)-N(2))-methyltransferase RlmL n=1 Tax=Guyparkeria hydrothermalis TaxID=923 RepID=UPI0020215039|nr:bifunctional 23S rRNA (guanine(2069)-N(7))-methyltransferase RlmK/23S rRNA (guanine(2445)-N(2))-methyltransferase RlmL [Guyparkeria hydrothermalis]MCL7743747.1 bifunctional 23S rRNA (guanine(2069)-N(7))-methyltransferase RlmK/23S rRNA (guanine(2445)-N(2))-methyltransferase RlmL [Guyparkeria hydrothermalis]
MSHVSTPAATADTDHVGQSPLDAAWTIDVIAPPGLETALAEELRHLTGAAISDRPYGASAELPAELVYRVLADSLIAGRVYLPIARGPAGQADQLYDLAAGVDWSSHLTADDSLSITATGGNDQLRHTGFIATRIKDAIVDQFRDATGRRPDVDSENPGLRIHCHVPARGDASLAIELSDGSLHRRGYRVDGGEAPLRENLAAGLLWRARWPQVAGTGAGLFDPMCGSGTFLIEAALAVWGMTPAMRQRRFGSPAWRGHDPAARAAIIDGAPHSWLIEQPARGAITIFGQDRDPLQLAAAHANIEAAGLGEAVEIHHADSFNAPCAAALEGIDAGLLISNVPFGQRVESAGDEADWARLCSRWIHCLPNWYWGILRGGETEMTWPLRFDKRLTVIHGGADAEFLRGQFSEKSLRQPAGPHALAGRLIAQGRAGERSAEDFANRLKKNWKQRQFLLKQGDNALRLYDADLPDFKLAVDYYRTEDGEAWLDIQEYQAPRQIDPQKARERLAAAVAAAVETLDIDENCVVVRQRARQSGRQQYGRFGGEHIERVIRERDTRLLINLTDYLDVGLFIDHRLVRDRLVELARGKRMLNLFCYTASASVRAAVGGARSTTSVDLSNTYLDWAEHNFELNGIAVGGDHQLIRADVLRWLDQAGGTDARYDVIFLDPPSFSNSKAMEDDLDIQRDHPALIEACMRLLAPEGVLLFSNNRKGFTLNRSVEDRSQAHDLSRKTLPKDFSRTPGRRFVCEIRHR